MHWASVHGSYWCSAEEVRTPAEPVWRVLVRAAITGRTKGARSERMKIVSWGGMLVGGWEDPGHVDSDTRAEGFLGVTRSMEASWTPIPDQDELTVSVMRSTRASRPGIFSMMALMVRTTLSLNARIG